jgi:DNA-binding NtrC family response regulator
MLPTVLPLRLLIVDDRPDVSRGMARYFGLFFESVYCAQTPEEAEALLDEHAPHMLLCDYWLGHEHPPGTALIDRWRARYSCLRCVAIMTGTKATAILATANVDQVFQKPLKLEIVKDWFLEMLAKPSS